MKKNLVRAIVLVFSYGLTTATVFAADKPVDFTAEKKQAEKEDADQQAERDLGVKGKYQKVFLGTVHWISEADPKLSPDVIGIFDTNDNDTKPGRHYQIKVEGENNVIAEALKALDGKSAQLTGKLRVIGSDGEAKYLIVSSVVEIAPTLPVQERLSGNGL